MAPPSGYTKESWAAYQRAWRKKNPEKTRESKRRWEANNPEKHKEAEGRRRLRRADKQREYNRAYYQQNREAEALRRIRDRLRRNYGLSPEDYQSMLDAQGGVCRLCGRTCEDGKRLAVDHCHSTESVRGLLCRKCNTALGLFRDDPAILERAWRYLVDAKAGDEGARMSKLRVEKFKNAGNVHLQTHAVGINLDFPTSWGAQLQQFVWEKLCDEAQRLGVDLWQEDAA